MSYIIHGATGAQGGPVLARLRSAGEQAVAVVRDADKLSGVASVQADNGSVDALVDAYRGAEGVFIHLPQGPEPVRVEQARNIVEAIRQARPGRIVLSTSGSVIDEPGAPVQAAQGSAVMRLVDGVRESGLSHAVVAPRLFLENLLLPTVFEPVNAGGDLAYPLRADFPVSWSSHLDVAEVVVRLLTDKTVEGLVGVGHCPGLTGADLAAGFSGWLGRAVGYDALSPEAFGELIRPMLGPAAAGVVGLYQGLSQAQANVIRRETSAQILLGLEPRPVGRWLEEALGQAEA